MALTPAEKQRRYRDRKKKEKEQAALQGTLPQVTPAVEKLVDAGTAARAARPVIEDMWAAFEAGLAARIFCEIAQGQTGGEDLLVAWLDSQPPGLWLFHLFIAEQGLWGQFESWLSSDSSRPAV